MKRLKALFIKDIQSEWRRPQTILGILFFQFSIAFLIFLFNDDALKIKWWSILYWLILLISAMSLTLHGYRAEHGRSYAYYYQISAPIQLFAAKYVYNFCLISFSAIVNSVLFYLLFGCFDLTLLNWFVLNIIVITGLTSLLTMAGFMAGAAQNAGVLMNIVCYPLIIPIFLLSINRTIQLLGGFQSKIWSPDMPLIIGVNLLMLAIGIGLFPYLWRR